MSMVFAEPIDAEEGDVVSKADEERPDKTAGGCVSSETAKRAKWAAEHK